jgi:hypothetical protein
MTMKGKEWWAWQGLNLRPLRCQHSAVSRKPQKSAVFHVPDRGTGREQGVNRGLSYRAVTAVAPSA